MVMGELKFNIEEHMAGLSTSAKGWTKALKRVSWNGAPSKLDIREWSPNCATLSKGITLTDAEAFELYKALNTYFKEKVENDG